MSRGYAVNGPSATGTANKTAVSIVGSTSVRIRVFEFSVGMTTAPNSTDQQLEFGIGRWTTSAGTAGSAPTPLAIDPGDVAAVATAGITLALGLAIPMALLSTHVLSVSALSGRMARGPFWLRQAVRWTMIVLRSIPELVWALVFVRVVGLGPTAGVLAIALTYGGMLGKVYAEILESSDTHATATLLRNGAGRVQAFFYGLLPASAAELTSYTVYRWECAIRSSVVLGFVGAGGLGQQMDNAMKMFNGGEVATMLLVALADRVSAWLRKALG